MKRPLVLLLLATLPGCLAVPFGYPTWSRTPALKVKADGDEVVALLVRREWSFYSSMNTPSFWGHEERKCDEVLAIDKAGGVTAQHRLSKDYFVAMTGILVWFIEAQRDRYEVLLYRPGYACITVPAWCWDHKVEWRAVAPAAQLAELGRLLVDYHSLTIEDRMRVRRFLESEWSRLEALLGNEPNLKSIIDQQKERWPNEAKGRASD